LIRKNTDGMVNLTDMWRAAGASPNKQPWLWWRQDSTQELVGIHGTNLRQAQVWTTLSGGGGGTWGIANLAIAYAKYLSPQFHAWANQAVIERMETRAIPNSIRLGSYVPYLSPKYLCRPDLDALTWPTCGERLVRRRTSRRRNGGDKTALGSWSVFMGQLGSWSPVITQLKAEVVVPGLSLIWPLPTPSTSRRTSTPGLIRR
jgi:hypothetical protein